MSAESHGLSPMGSSARRSNTATLHSVSLHRLASILLFLVLLPACYESHRVDEERSCVFEYERFTGGVATCSVAVEAPEPCRDAVRCLCESWVAEGNSASGDVRSCVESWLTPRGALTFADFCRPLAEDAPPLSEALVGFVGAYGESVRFETPAACAETPAVASY